MSTYLQKNIGKIHEDIAFKYPLPLISNERPLWFSRIRGDEKGNYYPAKEFLYDVIFKYIPEYCFIVQLFLPEAEINEITQVEVDDFNSQRVDFFLPQAKLVVEIDGQQHKMIDHTRIKDSYRDKHLAAHGVKTVRIDTKDLTEKNAKFVSKINAIKSRINEFHTIIEYYREPYAKPTEIYGDASARNKLLSTAIIRFQLLILECLERDVLQCDLPEWRLNVIERDIKDFTKLAVDDLFLWLKHICQLQHLEFRQPTVRLLKVYGEEDSTYHSNAINIDFSLLRRWTDEAELNPYWITVRTDYYDYQDGKRDNGKICVTDPIAYDIKPYGDDHEDTHSLRFILKNIFNKSDFKDGQLRIITNALSLRHTIGLLPTSGGKSLCYQFASLLQPAISFVVCPIKSLMYDQKYNLDKLFINRTSYITGDQAAEEKNKVASDFAKGRYLWIWISPERMQSQDFREELTSLNKNLSISYAVIDEVHCLSEWGHDFRTSYLNLSRTISKYLPASTYLGLTATASVNVLKDIKNEFEIRDENVKTLTHYSRPELEFCIVYASATKKMKETISILKKYLEKNEALHAGEESNGCGLIFTPHVNGQYGCYDLANRLSMELSADIRWFSGSVPKKKNKQNKKRFPVLKPEEFNSYKIITQQDFQEDKYPLLVATKAFGMGVNKSNIRYTIHYGIPGSMESLYQEAGRAGRDGKPAVCYVIFSPEEKVPRERFDKVFSFDTGLHYIRDIIDEMDDRGSNAFRVLSLWLWQQQDIDNELEMIMRLKKLCSPNACRTINSADVCGGDGGETSRISVEKAIYRMSILGIIDDWTVADWFLGVFRVQASDYNDKIIRQRLLSYIKKYDPEFSYSKAVKSYLNRKEDEQPVLVLLNWIYNHFGYNRRQSIKNVYEICEEYATKGQDAGSWFKNELESMFKFSEISHALDEIAENPTDIEKWFSIFYSNYNKSSNDIISKEKLNDLKNSLARFLESYQFNTGLNMISGIARLMNGDFDNADGKQRMLSALQNIYDSEQYNSHEIFSRLLDLGSKLSVSARQKLAPVLIEYFNDNVEAIYNSLKDDASLAMILNNANIRLKKIGGILYDRCAET